MNRFSERHGLIPPRIAIQRGQIDKRLKNRLWTVCGTVFWNNCQGFLSLNEICSVIIGVIQDGFFGEPVDELSDYGPNNVAKFKNWAFYAEWNRYYDFIQFLADFSKIDDRGEIASELRRLGEVFQEECNRVLESERSAYRFVGSELSEITDEGEIAAIEDALITSHPYEAARQHLGKALNKFADRDNPDYQNSIKEAVSCLESAFFKFNGEKSKSLSEAIKVAEKKGFVLHPALRDGVVKIYGWTSDEDGVRHAMLSGNTRIGSSEAKLMIVLCSAFLNYLISYDK